MVIETGELAKQANGSALIRYGDQNVVLCAVTASDKPREGIDFFPLTCDFEEKMYAAGKIPGGFIKREGRPREHAVLSSRQIDRPIRPLFPDGFRNDVQIVATVLSVDPELDADVLGVCAAGAALALCATFRSTRPSPPCASDATRTATYICNPTLPQYETGGMDIVVAGTADAVMMVEGGGNEIYEEEFLGAVEFAHAEIKKIVKAIDNLRKKAGKKKREYPVVDGRTTISTSGCARRSPRTSPKRCASSTSTSAKRPSTRSPSTKRSRAAARKTRDVRALLEDPATAKEFGKIIKAMEEDELRTMVVDEKIRPDGRKPDEIRPIWSKVHYVPRVHGSGVFTRGQTQVFTAATLGSTSDAQRLDGIVALEDKRYMHFYNFPPFSVGETRPMRGPGRREIGHGRLAERALLPVLPPKDEFPYTLRLMSEVLESNGSSSMASVCGSTLALMDAGVPITRARRRRRDGPDPQGRQVRRPHRHPRPRRRARRDGLQSRGHQKRHHRDSDGHQGPGHHDRDHARSDGRKRRSRATSSSISSPRRSRKPRAELSQYAPRMIVVKINPAKIKDVIGPGGKVINKIIADTGVEKIDIEDDGTRLHHLARRRVGR